jgi:hypothetical protein
VLTTPAAPDDIAGAETAVAASGETVPREVAAAKAAATTDAAFGADGGAEPASPTHTNAVDGSEPPALV